MDVIAIFAVVFWCILEAFHGVATPFVAAQLWYVMQHDAFFTWQFRLRILSATLLPVVLVNRLSRLKQTGTGIVLALAFLVELTLGTLLSGHRVVHEPPFAFEVIVFGTLGGALGAFSANCIAAWVVAQRWHSRLT